MNSDTQTHEAQILQQLIKNAERIAVTPKEVSEIKTTIFGTKKDYIKLLKENNIV